MTDELISIRHIHIIRTHFQFQAQVMSASAMYEWNVYILL